MPRRSFGKALGELIYQRRKALGLTQTQLAEEAFETSAKTRRISELENGLVANPHPRTIDPIINVLGISNAEIETCARETNYKPDQDLDRAYREARNLIETVARQFEHSKPTATLAELDEFLRAKAKEWADLRSRIELIDAPERSITNIKSAATEALSKGNFEEADLLLSNAEDVQQEARTLVEVRKQAQIRITRADICFFRGDADGALRLYLSAADFIRPFDEGEMVHLLEKLAERIYDVGRRSIKPSFFVAADLLETAISTAYVREAVEHQGRLNFRLGLVCRRAHESGETRSSSDYLSRGIECSRTALSSAIIESDPYRIASAKGGLANCLVSEAKRRKDRSALAEAINLLREVRGDFRGDAAAAELLATTCNNLGGALLEVPQLEGDTPDEASLIEAFEAFSDAVSAAELSLSPELWGAAKVNCGATLALRAKIKTTDAETVTFLRVQSIAAYLAAIESYPAVLFPSHYAEAHIGLARVLYDHAFTSGDDLIEFNLLRALASCESASSVFSKELYPVRWADIQVYAGSIFASHSEIDGAKSVKSDLQEAKSRLQGALRIFQENKSTKEASFCKDAIARINKKLASSKKL